MGPDILPSWDPTPVLDLAPPSNNLVPVSYHRYSHIVPEMVGPRDRVRVETVNDLNRLVNYRDMELKE